MPIQIKHLEALPQEETDVDIEDLLQRVNDMELIVENLMLKMDAINNELDTLLATN